MKTTFCPYCNKQVEYSTRKNLIENYKGYEVNIEENIAVCNECNTDIFVYDIESDNLKRLYEKYREMANIVNPEELIKFREKHNLTQIDLDLALGWNVSTTNKYELGGLMSKEHSDIIRFYISNEDLFKQKSLRNLKKEKFWLKAFADFFKLNNVK